MDPAEISAPDLVAVVRAAGQAGLPYVVIGGFAVIAHGHVRATRDSDLLIPDGEDTDRAALSFLGAIHATRVSDEAPVKLADIAEREHLRVNTDHGLVDLLRGGVAPLDFETVHGGATDVVLGDQTVRIASLRSIVGFKRLAGRPQDRADLAELEAIHGKLPIDSIPGLDS